MENLKEFTGATSVAFPELISAWIDSKFIEIGR